VPRNQGTAELIWDHRGTMLSSALRAYSLQFDDDANQFILPGYMTLQFMARRHLKGPLSAIAEVNNALNREYLFALTPTPNVGMPRVWMLGFRWN
jgi:outer membrane receptor protein involved in Fe transport